MMMRLAKNLLQIMDSLNIIQHKGFSRKDIFIPDLEAT